MMLPILLSHALATWTFCALAADIAVKANVSTIVKTTSASPK